MSLNIQNEPLRKEAEELIVFLRDPINREKLNGPFFVFAGSLIDRWRWNGDMLQGAELRKFTHSARELVEMIDSNGDRTVESRTTRLG